MMYNDHEALSFLHGMLGMLAEDGLSQRECISLCPTPPCPVPLYCVVVTFLWKMLDLGRQLLNWGASLQLSQPTEFEGGNTT